MLRFVVVVVGVFLLNASLTVVKANPNSHAKIGWQGEFRELQNRMTFLLENHHLSKQTFLLENHHLSKHIFVKNHHLSKQTFLLENHHLSIRNHHVALGIHDFSLGNHDLSIENHDFILGKNRFSTPVFLLMENEAISQ